MSPVGVRRYRAERLLRKEFDTLRERVLAAVQSRLRARGHTLDTCDLEACYAQAWQGLYAAVLEGQEIVNPAGWLVVVTHRRALDEQRARARAGRVLEQCGEQERDYAHELDERVRLRQLLEAMRMRLSEREREAAVLCYLQGLSRSQAAAQMGMSERAMRKLMEGRGAGRAGVSAKLGALVETIAEGRWCEQQGSLMRALAFGLLDPRGERYSAALLHSSRCPACRAYVSSLRGLAAAMPPTLPPSGLGAAILLHALHARTAGAGAVAAGGAGARAAGTSAAGGAGAGVGAGAAGLGGASGGGWLLAGGSVGAKLATGCVLALSIGAGCLALTGHGRETGQRARSGSGAARAGTPHAGRAAAAAPRGAPTQRAVSAAAVGPALTPAAKASREFGLEQPVGGPSGRSGQATNGGRTAPVLRARATLLGVRGGEGFEHRAAALQRAAARPWPASLHAPEKSVSVTARGPSRGLRERAEREFAPG